MKRLLTLIVAVTAISGSGATFPTDDRAIVHVLGRTAFGPRPGDVERVRNMGIQRYLDEQLRPERINDAGLSARLAGLTTINLSSRQIADQYEIPQLEARRQKKQDAKDTDPADQVDGKQPPDAMQLRANSVMVELSEQKLLRAIYSERQLQEVLTDFWFNHFNVDARKGADRFLLTEYERDTIRPRVLGKFRDLLGATAKSPAMLFYLDNWMSADPNGPHLPDNAGRPRIVRGPFGGRVMMPPMAREAQGNQAKKAPKGLNENYGRELMELHTLGVDGGYTQKDVTEVARALTGWSIDRPRGGGSFTFNPRLHDTGQKVVLGHVIKAGGGESDGEQVLDILAAHPSTATFIATKLARRFVSDTPPPALVERAAKRFRDTDGDLREVVRVDPHVAGVPVARCLPRQGQDAVRVRRERAARQRRRGRGRAAAGARGPAARHAALHVPAADRLQGHRRRLGEHRRARQPHEPRAAARVGPGQRHAGRWFGCRHAAGRHLGDDARNDRQGDRRAENHGADTRRT